MRGKTVPGWWGENGCSRPFSITAPAESMAAARMVSSPSASSSLSDLGGEKGSRRARPNTRRPGCGNKKPTPPPCGAQSGTGVFASFALASGAEGSL